jgi:putative colanic acid biosynthesis glycosyltransferase WcaI
MHVLIFNIYFHPDPTGTGLVIGQLARDLRAIGHRVTVVTTVTHYGLDSIPAPRRLISEEQWEGVRVLRTWTYVRPRRPLFGRVLNYLAFAILAIPAGLKANKHDVAVCVWPPVTTAIAAWLVTRLRRSPLVMNVQDVYPDSIFRNKLAARLNRALERLVLRSAAGVTVLSPGLKRAVIDRGARGPSVAVIPMWTDVDGIRPGPKENSFRQEHQLQGKFVVLYAGNLGAFSGVEIVLDAAVLLKDQDHIRFFIVGRGHARDRLVQKAADLNLSNLTFMDTRPREELSAMLAAADIALVTLNPLLATTNIPSKAFTIMASARPVLAAMNSENEIARIITEQRCGWCVPPDRPQDLARAIQHASDRASDLEEMGMRARRFVESHHARPPLTRQHATFLEQVSQKRTSP